MLNHGLLQACLSEPSEAEGRLNTLLVGLRKLQNQDVNYGCEFSRIAPKSILQPGTLLPDRVAFIGSSSRLDVKIHMECSAKHMENLVQIELQA